MAKKKKKQNYIMKDPFRFFAYFIVFICILLKELFIFHENGMFGIGLYNSCLSILSLLSLIFIISVKEAIQKAVLYRKSRGQVKNALQFIRLNSVLAFWIGVAGAFIFLFLGGIIRKWLNIHALGLLTMLFLSLALPFLLLISSYIGAFQAWGYSMPFHSGLLVFCISDFLFSVLCSLILQKAGTVNSALFHNEQILTAFFDGGAALGVLIAAVITACWLSVLYKIFRGHVKIDISDEFGKNYESIHDQRLGFLVSLGFPFLNSLLRILPFAVFFVFAFRFYPAADMNSPGHIISSFGVYSIRTVLWFFLPFAFASMLAGYAKDSLRNITIRDDRYHGGMRLLFLVKQFLCFVLPVICYTALITDELTNQFFHVNMEEVWLAGAFFSAFFALSMLLSACMNAFELTSVRNISRIAGLIAELVFLLFVARFDCTFLNLSISLVLCYGCICLFNGFFLSKFFVYKKQLFRHIMIPLISLAVYALCVYFVFALRDSIGFLLSAVLSFFAAFLLQSMILVISGAVRDNEKNEYPQKFLLQLIGRLFKIYS